MARPHLLDVLREPCCCATVPSARRVLGMPLDMERDFLGKENCTDVLNLSRPDLVRDIHRGYFEAGADMVETNTSAARRSRWASSASRIERSRSTGAAANWRARRRSSSRTAGIAG